MSQDNTTQSWSMLGKSLLTKLGSANLNPIAYVADKVEEKKAQPVPVEKEAAEAEFKLAQTKLKLAKDRVSITKKASATIDEMTALGDKLVELGFEDQGNAFKGAANGLRSKMAQ